MHEGQLSSDWQRGVAGQERQAEVAVQKIGADRLRPTRAGISDQDPSFLKVFASQFLPDGTPEECAEFTNFQRKTTSPENAAHFLEAFARIDVLDIAGRVQCPTLILHSRHDVRVPASQASELAALIPNSRLVLLESRNHLLSSSEPAWIEFLDHVEEFLDQAA